MFFRFGEHDCQQWTFVEYLDNGEAKCHQQKLNVANTEAAALLADWKYAISKNKK